VLAGYDPHIMRILTDLLASLQSGKSRPGTAHSQHTLEVATAVLLIGRMPRHYLRCLELGAMHRHALR
jgi:hypothetical protein